MREKRKYREDNDMKHEKIKADKEEKRKNAKDPIERTAEEDKRREKQKEKAEDQRRRQKNAYPEDEWVGNSLRFNYLFVCMFVWN